MGHLAEEARSNQPDAHRKHRTPPASQPEAAPDSRLGTLPAQVDTGEQIVGSDHIFQVLMPYNIGHRGTASVSVGITGDPAFSIHSFKAELEESGRLSGDSLQDQLEHPMVVGFAPTHRGQSEAVLTLVACWSDGHIEQQQVRVIGRARELDDAPTPSPAELAEQQALNQAEATSHAREEQAYADPSWRNRPMLAGPTADLDGAEKHAENRAEFIATERGTGVDTVRRNVGTYKAPPVEQPLWKSLAELALTVACGTIGEHIAKAFGEKLASAIVGSASDGALADSVGNLVKLGLAEATASAIELARQQGEPSHDPQTAFFEHQYRALDQLQKQNADMVVDRWHALQPTLQQDPSLALHAMQALADALDESGTLAEQRQKEATTAQWFAFKAQYANGAIELPHGHEHIIVTDLRSARPSAPAVQPRVLVGVLDIDVDVDHGPVHPVAAYSRGVAQAAADDLRGLNLRDAHVPVRLVLGADQPEPTIITRDEAGRVRVSGDLSRLATFDDRARQPTDEIQAERAARAVCDLVLARTLAQWKVDVTTDDRTPAEKHHA